MRKLCALVNTSSRLWALHSKDIPSPAPLALHISRVLKQVVPFVASPPEHPWVSGPPLKPGSFPPLFHLSIGIRQPYIFYV